MDSCISNQVSLSRSHGVMFVNLTTGGGLVKPGLTAPSGCGKLSESDSASAEEGEIGMSIGTDLVREGGRIWQPH